VEKGSAAEKAGLKDKDVITSVGCTPVANLLDFEMGLFRARKEPCVSLTVHRQGAGTLTLALPLDVSDVAGKTSAADCDRLRAEQVGVTCLVSSRKR
jgi:S1-C subfamily serine protease